MCGAPRPPWLLPLYCVLIAARAGDDPTESLEDNAGALRAVYTRLFLGRPCLVAELS